MMQQKESTTLDCGLNNPMHQTIVLSCHQYSYTALWASLSFNSCVFCIRSATNNHHIICDSACVCFCSALPNEIEAYVKGRLRSLNAITAADKGNNSSRLQPQTNHPRDVDISASTKAGGVSGSMCVPPKQGVICVKLMVGVSGRHNVSKRPIVVAKPFAYNMRFIYVDGNVQCKISLLTVLGWRPR